MKAGVGARGGVLPPGARTGERSRSLCAILAPLPRRIAHQLQRVSDRAVFAPRLAGSLTRSNRKSVVTGRESRKDPRDVARWSLGRGELERLLAWFHDHGYTAVGPRRRDGAIVYAELSTVEDLPIGWTQVTAPGTYRLERRDDEAVFGFTVGPHSFRSFFQVPREPLLTLRRRAQGIDVQLHDPGARKLVLFGARACDLAALRTHDAVLMRGAYRDPRYAARREQVLVVAVHCTEPSATCFCDSMQTGPRATAGFDLALVELLSPAHEFIVEAGTPEGERIVAELALPYAESVLMAQADTAVDAAKKKMGRKLETEGLADALAASSASSHWDAVAQRCLSCANCTLVCPTCFCSTVEDHTDIDGNAHRLARHDSCFTTDHSYIHGGAVRGSISSRYRQWLTHKLSTWHDQFGSSGCVGCGRCIAWCPAGIDLTEEVARLRNPAPLPVKEAEHAG